MPDDAADDADATRWRLPPIFHLSDAVRRRYAVNDDDAARRRANIH